MLNHIPRSPDYQKSFESTGLLVQEKKFNIDFQDGGHGSHLGFQSEWLAMAANSHFENIFTVFNLQVTLIFHTKFGVNWPFGSWEEAQNRFSRWRPSWISDGSNFSYFCSISSRYFLPSFESDGPIVDVAWRTTHNARRKTDIDLSQ